MAKALNYIKEKLARPISIDQIVLASGVWRRTLYGKFSRLLGRSIHTEIVRQRINLAKNLLATTDEKLDSISFASGFDNASSFGKAFRAHEGMTPSCYREKFPFRQSMAIL